MEEKKNPLAIRDTVDTLPFTAAVYTPEAPLPPPPKNARVPFDLLQPVPEDCTLSEAILLEKVIVELSTQLSTDDRFKSALESARISDSLFSIGELISPVTNAGGIILYPVVLVGAARSASLSSAVRFEEYDLIRRDEPAIKESERVARILYPMQLTSETRTCGSDMYPEPPLCNETVTIIPFKVVYVPLAETAPPVKLRFPLF